MTTNTRYITRVFPLTLLVCAASVFAMEEKKEDQLSVIKKKYNKYGETFLLEPKWNTSCIKIESLEVTKQNLKRYAKQFVLGNESLIKKLNQKDQYFKSFAVLTEAVSDIKENLDYTIPIIDGLGITPNAAVHICDHTKTGKKIGSSILGLVACLMVEKPEKEKRGMEILEDLLKRGANPDKLEFYKILELKRKVFCQPGIITMRRMITHYNPNNWDKHVTDIYDGQYKLYGQKEDFYTPRQLFDSLKKQQQDLSVNQNKTIENINSLFEGVGATFKEKL